jgi:hypothetical protein
MEDPFSAIGEAWPPDGPAADALFKCAWYDHYTVAQTLVGFGRGTPPWSWPGSPNLRCLSLGRIVGSGHPRVLQAPRGVAPNVIPAGWVEYDYAIIPANFGILPYAIDTSGGGGGGTADPIQDPSGQPWTTTRFRISSEVVQPPGGTFYYKGDIGALVGKPAEKSQVGFMKPKIEISMTRHRVVTITPYIATISTLIGRINDSPLSFADVSFNKGCLLFGGFSGTESFDSIGNMTYEIEYSIIGQDEDWNWVMGRDGITYELNTKPDGTGRGPFRYADFGTIP